VQARIALNDVMICRSVRTIWTLDSRSGKEWNRIPAKSVRANQWTESKVRGNPIPSQPAHVCSKCRIS
jgi:hypothetical protein